MTKSFIAALSAIVVASSLATAQANPKVYSPQFDNEANQSGDEVPQVQVWLNEQGFHYGDIIRPYVQTDPGAYLTVVRVSSDGQLRVLYPRRPKDQVRYKEGQFANDRLPNAVDRADYLNEGTGNGFVFAIASYYRFDYGYYATETGYWWSTARLASAGRYGSPFEIVRRFVEEIMDGSDSYSMDYVMYNVAADRYRSRYASRFANYAFNDYLDLCFNSFGYTYYNYCRGYGYGYGYGFPTVVINNPNPRDPAKPNGKSMRIRPLTVDPVLPHGPPELPTVQGRFPVSNPSEDAAVARKERMLRDARPRYEPTAPVMRDFPRNEPRSQPRSEPRMAPPPAPRSEPRIEMRKADPPPPRERPQKDNQN
jgi:hypothetical protein